MGGLCRCVEINLSIYASLKALSLVMHGDRKLQSLYQKSAEKEVKRAENTSRAEKQRISVDNWLIRPKKKVNE